MTGKRRIIIVGAGWAGQTVASTIMQYSFGTIVGFVDDNEKIGAIKLESETGTDYYKIIGRSGDLLDIVLEYKADCIVIAVTHDDRENHLLSQIVRCYENGIPIYEMSDLYERLARRIPVQHVNHRWIMPQMAAPKNGGYILFYDLVNYVFSLLGSIFILFPVYFFIAIVIKLDSKGPVFFRQRRVGKRGQIFQLLKFRTMIKNAAQNGSAWTAKSDWRITRVGKFLRRYRLDELPQFINILRGEMALIGPRPEAIELVEKFKKEIPFYEYRYLVLPGITGWAQVNYGNTCSIDGALEKLQYDLYWIKNRSFWLDLLIMFKSVHVVMTGYGAV